VTALKKKRRVRRRSASPLPRPGFPEGRLRRVSQVVTWLGIVALVAALAVQVGLLPLGMGPRGVMILKVAAVGMVIAGFVFGRGPRR
jgi:hypothetical protein